MSRFDGEDVCENNLVWMLYSEIFYQKQQLQQKNRWYRKMCFGISQVEVTVIKWSQNWHVCSTYFLKKKKIKINWKPWLDKILINRLLFL